MTLVLDTVATKMPSAANADVAPAASAAVPATPAASHPHAAGLKDAIDRLTAELKAKAATGTPPGQLVQAAATTDAMTALRQALSSFGISTEVTTQFVNAIDAATAPAESNATEPTKARAFMLPPGQWVSTFGTKQVDPNEPSYTLAEMKEELGGKGGGLLDMHSLGVPVPPGFTISTRACAEYFKADSFPAGLQQQVETSIKEVEGATDKRLGDPRNPLLVSVRSGAKVSMPGMMDTVLNLGLNDEVAAGLAKVTGNPRFAYDSYRRFIQMYGDVVMGVPSEKFEHALTDAKSAANVKDDTQLTADQLEAICGKFKKIYEKQVGKPFPTDPKEQLDGAVKAVFGSWNSDRAIKYREINKIEGLRGTAVTVQSMAFGNLGEDSGTGVCFTRDPSTGAPGIYGDFMTNAQGEDVVAGIRTPMPIAKMAEVFPEAYAQLVTICAKLEKHNCDMQDLEFTVERRKLYMLQTRDGKRSGDAAVASPSP